MEIAIDNRTGLTPEVLSRIQARIQRTLKGLVCSEQTELSVVITTDPDIALLNQQYLDRPGPTNVIAFPMAEGEFAQLNPHILGDVVVSLDTARREAAEYGLDPDRHLMRLIIHGILHLQGHDHVHNQQEAAAMEELTEKLLTQSAAPSGEE